MGRWFVKRILDGWVLGNHFAERNENPVWNFLPSLRFLGRFLGDTAQVSIKENVSCLLLSMV